MSFSCDEIEMSQELRVDNMLLFDIPNSICTTIVLLFADVTDRSRQYHMISCVFYDENQASDRRRAASVMHSHCILILYELMVKQMKGHQIRRRKKNAHTERERASVNKRHFG